MTPKLRLFGSMALGVVAAASAHGQASASANAYAQIFVTGFYTVDGRTATVDSYSGGSYYTFFGTYGTYSNTDTPLWSSDGSFAQAFGFSYAAPTSDAFHEALVDNTIVFSNFHNYGVFVDFIGTTYAGGSAYQAHVNNEGYASAQAQIFVSNRRSSYVIQSSGVGVFADNGFGGDNGWSGYNSDIYGFYYGFRDLGFGSPYTVSWAYGVSTYLVLYLAPYSTGHIEETVYEAHYARAATPGPAAVAPFAVGLIGALKRRSKKR